jgi:hypothetical protein
MRVGDLLLAIWIAAWIAMGVVVAGELRDLRQLSDTVVQAGRATEEVGRTLDLLGDVPLVGDRLAEPARQIEQAGTSSVRSGRTSRRSVEHVSTLLGIALAVIPTVPVAAFYLPRRLRWQRDRRALSAVQRAAGGDPRFELWLARRALERLPYERVAEIVDRPWEPADEQAARRLAAAELGRYGLRPSSR